MIKLVIVDDERHCISALQYLLKRIDVPHEVISVFDNPIAARDFLAFNDVDLLLLDVQMPEMSGFELLVSLEEIRFEVVFTTAHDHFAVAAFKLNALDYLLKPIEKEDLERALLKLQGKSEQKQFAERLARLLREVTLPAGQGIRLRLPTAQGFELVDPTRIIRLEADGNYTRVVFADEAKLYSKPLGALEPLLPSRVFFRTHHSHIVNLEMVVAYHKGKGGELALKNGHVVPVARNRKDQLMLIL